MDLMVHDQPAHGRKALSSTSRCERAIRRVPATVPRVTEIRSEALRSTLDRALATGDVAELSAYLARSSHLPGPRPNLELAAAAGEALAAAGRPAERIVREFASLDADDGTPYVFLPMVAAYALAASIGKDVRAAERTLEVLGELGEDERSVVRRAVEDALATAAPRFPGGVDAFVNALVPWCGSFSRGSVALGAIGDRRVLDAAHDQAALVAAIDAATTALEDAPRAKERDPGRRRLLDALPRAVTAAATASREVAEWLAARAATSRHADVRRALEEIVSRLRNRGERKSERTAAAVALVASAKAPRDPTLIREGMRGRGKKRRDR